MKNKITIDKLIAGLPESLPPPDADMMWAEMTARLDAEAATGAAHPDVEAVAGPGAASITGIGWMTVAAYLLSGLLGAGALYALATGRWAWPEKEKAEATQAADPAFAVGSAPQLAPMAQMPPVETASTAAGAAAAASPIADAAARRAASVGAAATSKNLSADLHNARRQKTSRANPSSAAAGLATPPQAAAAAPQSMVATSSVAPPPVAPADNNDPLLLPATHSGSAAAPVMPAPTAWAIALLPTLSAVATRAQATPLAATPTPVNRRMNYQLRGLIFYIGSSLSETPRRYQNFTPKLAYLNAGLAYRLPVARRWSIQPELWFMQLETPSLSVVTEQRYDLDGRRWLRYDTLSVMRMQGLSLSLAATTELRGGIVLMGGAQLGWFPRAMQERSYSEESEVTGSRSWGANYTYSYEPAPYWLSVWQPGLKLGIEKILWRKAVLGINLHQGLADITRLPGAAAPPTYSRSWLAYMGYRF